MKRVFLTGANRGIGLEFVRQMAARGDRVFAGARSPETAADLVALAQEHPNQISLITIDVTDPRTIEAAAEAVARQAAALDLVINNAGILERGEKLGTLSAEVFNQTMAVNVTGPALVTQAFVDLLAKGDEPRLVNLTSQLGSITRKTSASTYSYSASKAALNMLTKAMSYELSGHGITAVMVHPGWVQTDMGGPNASITPPASVSGMLALIDDLTPGDNGTFYQWDGKTLPW